MLSLLSLLIASGTVLRPDTELWTPITYPDPRVNATLCNSKDNSTVCDPDHLLSDQWRATIDETVRTQVERLHNTSIQYVDDAPEECMNETESFQMYVLLARRINATVNSTVTSDELKTFGDGLVEQMGLNNQTCKNFLVLIVVETAHSAYARTGRHIRMPADLMEQAFNSSTNPFTEKNYMEVLNQIVEKIGDSLMKIFEPSTEPPTEAPVPQTSETLSESTEDTTTSSEKPGFIVLENGNKSVMVLMLCLTVILIIAITTISYKQIRDLESNDKPISSHFREFTNAYNSSSSQETVIRDTVTIPQMLDADLEGPSAYQHDFCRSPPLTAVKLSTDAGLPKTESPSEIRKTL
ncbi:unnamed protein product, partial [Mesorhabditis spiculigera]